MRSSFRMPNNFNGFPSCPECGCKNFSKKFNCTLEEEFGPVPVVYICDNCSCGFYPSELGIDNSTVEGEPLAQKSKVNKSAIEEEVYKIEREGGKVNRIRMPEDL